MRGTVRMCTPQYQTPDSISQCPTWQSLTQLEPPVGDGTGTPPALALYDMPSCHVTPAQVGSSMHAACASSSVAKG